MPAMNTMRQFWRNRRGSVGVVAALGVPVLVLLVGGSIDYSRLELIRSRLQHAADASALAIAQAQVLDQAAPAGEARPIVDANVGTIEGFTMVDVDVDQDGAGYARVEITGTAQTFFLGLAGFGDIAIAVDAVAEFSTSPDLNFTIAVDASPSMLIGASLGDIADLESNFGCAFACHYPGHGHLTTGSYAAARAMGIDTRLDAAREAVLRAFQIAEDNVYARNSDTYFDVDIFSRDVEDVVEGRASDLLEDAGTAVAGIMPVPRPPSHIYEMTNITASLQSLSTIALEAQSDHPDRLHFVLVVTDGVADYRSGSRRIEPIDPAVCDAIKNAGIRLGVIYTTYFEIPSNSFWRNRVEPFTDQIGPRLEQCATPGWFFEAEFAADIDEAFEELMRLAIPRPRLTF